LKVVAIIAPKIRSIDQDLYQTAATEYELSPNVPHHDRGHLGKDVITITKTEDSVRVVNFKQAIGAILSKRVTLKSRTAVQSCASHF
jgi:predicted metallo-beta-lactamase superfamily hydrolase